MEIKFMMSDENLLETIPFYWKTLEVDEIYSSALNDLITNKKTSMSVEDCKEYAKMVGAIDIESQIESILESRKKFKNELISSNISSNYLGGMTVDEYVENAYPLEILFVYRY